MTIIQLEYLLAVANCREFFVGRRTLFRDAAVAEYADQIARRGAGRRPARPFEETRDRHRGGRGGAGTGPRDAAGLRQYPRIGRRVEGRNSGAAASGRHPDRRALPAAQVPAGIRARLSPCGVGGQGVDDARHRRCDEARPHRRRAGGRRAPAATEFRSRSFSTTVSSSTFRPTTPSTNVRTFASKTSTCAI